MLPPDFATVFQYRLYTGANHVDVPGLLAGEEEYDGETWLRAELGDFSAAGPGGLVVFAKPHLDDVGLGVAFKAFEVHDAGGDGPSFWYAFYEPIVGYVALDEGETKTATGIGVLAFGPDDPSTLEITTEYTLESKEATVEVPYGTVEGCWHIHLEIYETVDGYGGDMSFPADLWLKDDLGLVKITMAPGFDAVELISYELPM